MDTTLLSHHDYNELPPLYEATKALGPFSSIQKLMLFGDIFLKHALHNTWGLCLIHRHFELKSNEIMLEQPAGSDTRTVTKAVDASKINMPLTGSSYRFQKGKLQAFEYCYDSDTVLETSQNKAFLCDLEQTLIETGLRDILGLIPMKFIKRGIESTNYVERENVVEPLTDDNLVAKDTAVATVWTFNNYGPGVQMRCVEYTWCYKPHPSKNDHYNYKRHENVRG